MLDYTIEFGTVQTKLDLTFCIFFFKLKHATRKQLNKIITKPMKIKHGKENGQPNQIELSVKKISDLFILINYFLYLRSVCVCHT